MASATQVSALGAGSAQQQRDGLQEWQDASQVLSTSGRAKADAGSSGYACLALPMGHSTLALTRSKEILPMRVPVIDSQGTVLMPCTPPKARALLKAKKARPKRGKLGIFYIQLTYQQPDVSTQPLVVGIDPGSKFEGFSVVGTTDTVLNLMVEAPTHVKKAVETRRTLRRARRFRLWRRPCRSQNRLRSQHRLPPSTRSRWEAKARIVGHLATILPLSDAAVEDVQAAPRPGVGGRWNVAFSPVQVGKEHLYQQLKDLGLTVHLYPGVVTKQLREQYGLPKSTQKDQKTFSSHAVDAWVLAAV